jgi:hypothetical protein
MAEPFRMVLPQGKTQQDRCQGAWHRERTPKGWEHPYTAENGTPRDSRECRVTATNLQFEAFDPLHRRFRRWDWYRPEMEAEQQKLDDHPAVEIMPYQADMLAIWCQ